MVGSRGNNRTALAILIGIGAAIVSIGAGVYLLTHESASADSTVFDILMHGIGAYFVARGLWMVVEIIPFDTQ